MRRYDKHAVAVVAAFAILVLCGEAIAYGPNPYHTDIDFKSEAGGVEYTISSNTASDYAAVLLTTTGNYDISSAFIFFDERYPSTVRWNYLKEASDLLISDLKVCGMKNVKRADADDLADIMAGGADGSVAIVFLTGSLPDTVYDGSPASPILKWLEEGGVIYWAGNQIGRYVSHIGEDVAEETTGYGERFFGASDYVQRSLSAGLLYSDVRARDWSVGDALGVYYNDLTCGVDIHGLSDYRAIGYTDGSYESAAFVKFHSGKGMLAIFGGTISSDSSAHIARLLSSGADYGTEILGVEKGTVRGNTVSGNISLPEDRKCVLYILVGCPMTILGKAYVCGGSA